MRGLRTVAARRTGSPECRAATTRRRTASAQPTTPLVRAAWWERSRARGVDAEQLERVATTSEVPYDVQSMRAVAGIV